MLFTTLAFLSGVTAPAASAAPLAPAATAAAELNVYYETDPRGVKFTAQLRGGGGESFALFARSGTGTPTLVRVAPLGHDIHFVLENRVLRSLKGPLELFAAYRVGGERFTTPVADLVLGTGLTCDELDFNYTLGPDDVMVAGRVIDNQWAEMSMLISADNATPGHPDLAILFDSSNPTGGDLDLATPNAAAVNNNTAYGNLLIIAENDVDVNPADGLVDDPDDEQYGGSLYFDFAEKAAICSVTLVDIDELPGTQLRFYRNGNLATPDETLNIASLGNGSVQRVDFYEPDVDRFEVFFQGSGGVARVELIPCPRTINFDETSTGIPRNLGVGEWITDQFQNIGVTIETFNNTAGHPDKAIVFDSENPTGEDFDLLTPNPLILSNSEPLGKVLIIAEDDVDVLAPFGFVDDPDDEEYGGQIEFTFDDDVVFKSARVLDVDGFEVDYWRFYDSGGAEITSILIPDAENGNVQLIEANVAGVRKAVLDLGGSGAVTRIRFCPDTNPKKK